MRPRPASGLLWEGKGALSGRSRAESTVIARDVHGLGPAWAGCTFLLRPTVKTQDP